MSPRLRIAAWTACCATAFVLFAAWTPPLRWALLRLAPLGWAIALIAACHGFGSLIARRDRLVATAYGIGIAGAFFFAAALLHAVWPPLFLGVIAAGDALSLAALWRERPRLAIRSPLAAAMFAAMLVAVVPLLVAPETSYDATAYHLLIPKLYLEHGGIVPLPRITEASYPPLAECHYLVLLALSGDVACKGFHFLCALLLGAAITRLARGRVLAAALFLTMPVAAICAAWAWNDMLFTLFVVLSLTELLERRMLSAGVLFGLATATKYTFVLAGVGIAAVLIRGVVRREWTWRGVLRFALPVAAIALVWMAKNAATAGNPIAPFPTPSRALHASLTATEMTWDWRTLVVWPFVMTLRPQLIDIHPGLLPLLLLPLAFARGDARASALRTYAGATAAGWMLTRTVIRSLFSTFAVLFALYALAPRRRLVSVIVAAGTVVNVLITLTAVQTQFAPFEFFIGRETRQQYLERQPSQRIYTWLNARPDVRGVLLVDISEPFQLQRPALFSGRFDTPVAQELIARAGTPEALAGMLARGGITHVAVDRVQYSRHNAERQYTWSDAQRAQFAAFLRTRCTPVAQFGDYVVFALH